MLKIKPKSESTKLNDQSILELFDYSELEKSYKTMKISWHHKVRLTIVNFYEKQFLLMFTTTFTLLTLLFLSIGLNILLLELCLTTIIFGLLFLIPYNDPISNTCKKITNYFNGDSIMEDKFYLLKQKLLSQEGKQILTLSIHNDDYGYLVKDIITNLLSNHDAKLLDDFLKLAKVQKTLKNKNAFKYQNLLDDLKNHIT